MSAGSRGQHLLSDAALARVEGGAVDVDDDLCARGALDDGGANRIPDVLADVDADVSAVYQVNRTGFSGAKVAVFIEDAVVGQEHLVIDVYEPTVISDCRRVVHFGVHSVREARDDRYPLGMGDDAFHEAAIFFQELRFEKQVLGRVARYGEFGERDQIGPRLSRPLDVFDDLPAVAFEVADSGVYLRERDSEVTHCPGECECR